MRTTDRPAGGGKSPAKMTAVDWILSGDTGISSEVIWAVMMRTGVNLPWWKRDVPHDGYDFGRCYRLLQHFPEWRERLCEVAEMYHRWTPIVNAWDELTELYEQEMRETGGRDLSKTYRRLHELRTGEAPHDAINLGLEAWIGRQRDRR